MKKELLALAAAGMFAPVGATYASTIVSYNDFSSTAGLTLVGNTSTPTTSDGTVLRVAPATYGQSGAAYSTTPVTLGTSSTFSTTFQFRLTSPGGINPADGLTFVLAKGSSGLGGAGGGIGYAGVPNSVAIEFDTYNNGGGDANSSNHVGIDTNGSLSSVFLASPYGVSTCDWYSGYLKPGCMSNGNIWSVAISYDGSLLDVWVQDGASSQQHIINSYSIDLTSDLGTSTAYVGFTSATGSGYENHDVLNWRFANTTDLAPGGGSVPEPGILGLVGLGLSALTLVRRRNSRK